MKASGSRAYGYARLRAWKSRLLTREDIIPLLTVTDADRLRRAIDPPPFEKLIRIYQTVLRTNRAAAPLVRAMLRLHEIENVKLLWRAAVRRRAFDSRLSIPLGNLAALPETANAATTPRELADALAKTPYGAIANDVLRAYSDDLGSAELAFDRWASRQLLDEARKLPKRESLARQLIELVVRDRDSEIVKRGEKWFGLSPEAAASAVLKPDPHGSRIRRVRLCERAFRGDPFAIAPVIALILLAEAEVRAVRALIERQGDAALDAPFARATEESQVAP